MTKVLARWTVTVGVEDQGPIPGMTKVWEYTNRDEAVDKVAGYQQRFDEKAEAAQNYAMRLVMPHSAYYVNSDFRWLVPAYTMNEVEA